MADVTEAATLEYRVSSRPFADLNKANMTVIPFWGISRYDGSRSSAVHVGRF